jgi:hypothetical protein
MTMTGDISSTPFPTSVSISQTIILTDTQTPSPTSSPSPTFTSTPTLFPTTTNTPLPTQFAFLPNLYNEHFIPTYTPYPPDTVLFCDDLNQPIAIPDNDPNGINDDISIVDGRLLVNVRLYLDISHSWVGDLVVTLSNMNISQTITAIHRPGPPPYGCSNSDIVTILDRCCHAC